MSRSLYVACEERLDGTWKRKEHEMFDKFESLSLRDMFGWERDCTPVSGWNTLLDIQPTYVLYLSDTEKLESFILKEAQKFDETDEEFFLYVHAYKDLLTIVGVTRLLLGYLSPDDEHNVRLVFWIE